MTRTRMMMIIMVIMMMGTMEMVRTKGSGIVNNWTNLSKSRMVKMMGIMVMTV